ncbi:hypothetical protein [Amycolatopsis viridis]|uniref:Uncharacterized protein n=1 Tax=Amycolatopsis viridis TaxID=185678 RepID=A0ABX0SV70_9PSEU|nr:hypothetical protein [Amycolatopsis viridis]NIH80867.1 hypothetical protein [Amycolatopsis viridis]
MAEEARAGAADPEAWRPRWWFLGMFAVLAGIHLSRGWDTTAAIGLPVGFAVTLVLVFVRRLPSWVTGEWAARPTSRRWVRAQRNRLTCLLPFVLLGVAAVVSGVDDHRPQGDEVAAAVFVLVCALGLALFVMLRWLRAVRTLRLLAGPRTALSAEVHSPAPFDDPVAVTGTVTFPDGSPGSFTARECPIGLATAIADTATLHVTSPRPGRVLAGLPDSDEFARVTLTTRRFLSRTELTRRLRVRTVALAAVVAAAAAVEVTAWITLGGAVPWLLPVPLLLAVAGVAVWRSDVARLVRLLAAGSWTAVAAATLDDPADSGPVTGWARFPDGVRARFRIAHCPPGIATELRERRRLWIAGEPHEDDIVAGTPDGDDVALVTFGVRRREYRRLSARTGPAAAAGDR